MHKRTHGLTFTRWSVPILVISALVLAACAPAAAPSPAPAKPAAEKPAEKPAAAPAKPAEAPKAEAAKPAAKIDYKAEIDKIYQVAKGEGGTLSLYSSMNLDDAKVILPEFEKAFPGIKVDHVRATGEVLQQRLITEVKGGKVLADVLDTNIFQVYPVIQEGFIEAYQPPNGQDLPQQYRDPQGFWTTQRVTTVTVAYNTNLVPASEAPKNFDDLADPKWKGKMIMEEADQEMFMTLLKQKFASEEQGLEVFRKIGANNPEVHAGHSQIAEYLAAGQGAVCMGCYGHHIIALKAKGAPVEFAKTEGVFHAISLGLLKGAPHPNTGKLWINWLLSPDGQGVLGAAGRAPARPETPISTPLKPEGMKWYVSQADYYKEYNKYDALWREIFKIRQ